MWLWDTALKFFGRAFSLRLQITWIESRRSSQGGVHNPCTLPLDPPMDKAKYSRHNSTKYPVLVSLTGHTAEGPSILIDSIYIFSAIGFSNNFEYCN